MSLHCLQILNSTKCWTKFWLCQISGCPKTADAKSGPLALLGSENIYKLEIFSMCPRKYLQAGNILHRNK